MSKAREEWRMNYLKEAVRPLMWEIVSSKAKACYQYTTSGNFNGTCLFIN